MPLPHAIIIPTDDRRHMPAIREGKISAEVWGRKRLDDIPVDHDAMINVDADLSVLKNPPPKGNKAHGPSTAKARKVKARLTKIKKAK